MMSSIFSWNLGAAGAPALPSSPAGSSAAGSPLLRAHLEFPSGNERPGMGTGKGEEGGPGGRCVRHMEGCCGVQIIEQEEVKTPGLETVLEEDPSLG